MLVGTSGGGSGEIYFGNSNHGVGRDIGITNFTDGNDVVLHTAGSRDAGLKIGSGFLKLTNTGNVGIGIETQKLDVAGTIKTNSKYKRRW